MVLPIHETGAPEWPKWRRSLTRLLWASVLLAIVWWLVSRDKTETMIAAAVPWAIALGFLAATLVSAVVIVPLMVLTARFCGGGNRGQEKRTANRRAGER